ncbi:FmdB family zinc ribbon protein [Rhodoferax aquaticus]|uniref:Zinc ribbon domain-containing protein n=1 Tax=Rhodoferax aquaticus TaxID=2527691 RepID=A0A515EM76_9BURK|nr:FmdB family zinc ribbon protein [Rhodoferax aquaticus]QDL53744.1 zinc ribbon domain-containing protein [Rhodoferax aquaticus]
MPIYAYKCDSCGFAKDVLQKMSDSPLEVCPSCSQPAFKKQVTAAGFQLKGSGWYVTDFKGGNAGSSAASAPAKDDTAVAPATDVAKPASVESTPAASPSVAAPATVVSS